MHTRARAHTQMMCSQALWQGWPVCCMEASQEFAWSAVAGASCTVAMITKLMSGDMSSTSPQCGACVQNCSLTSATTNPDSPLDTFTCMMGNCINAPNGGGGSAGDAAITIDAEMNRIDEGR